MKNFISLFLTMVLLGIAQAQPVVQFQKVYPIIHGKSMVRQHSDGAYTVFMQEDPYQNINVATHTDNQGFTISRDTMPAGTFIPVGYYNMQPDGSFLVGGTNPTQPSGFRAAIRRINANFSQQWIRDIPNISYISASGITSVIPAVDGNGYIGVGVQFYPGVGRKLCIFRVSETGDSLWLKNYQPADSAQMIPCDIKPLADGYLVFFRNYSDNPQTHITENRTGIMQITSNGEIQWIRTHVHEKQRDLYCVRKANDGNYLLLSNSTGILTLTKIDGQGNLLWDRKLLPTPISNSGYEIPSIVMATNGDMVMAFTGWTDTSGIGALSGLVMRVSQEGEIRWLKPVADDAKYLIATNDGGYAVLGNTSTRITFSKLSADTYTSLPTAPALALTLSPNPAKEKLRVSLSEAAQGATLEILSIEGKTLRTHRVAGTEAELSLTGLAQGLYLLRIFSVNGATETLRFVKE